MPSSNESIEVSGNQHPMTPELGPLLLDDNNRQEEPVSHLRVNCGVKGIKLNLENENDKIVVFGSDTAIKERDLVKCTRSIMDVPTRKAMLGHVAGELGVPIE
ncbi:hypothetical protein KIW84_042941 [Lathyrus oleraceus]|uniref:Uncharacterized protein n=1 Tax=Pisum sativum TaxID=3888 RepID=A0A9D4XEA7_PEA|nr:hypothetical protein KIW84_042941 [Pisum sativum]